MILRKGKPQDAAAIVALAVESVTTIDPIPELKIDPEAMKDMVELCMQPAHLCLVIEQDGVVVGALGAQVTRGFWFRGLQCSVLMHYCRAPGGWVMLMRECARWIKSRSGIKLAVIEVEDCHGPRILRFIERLGFSRPSTNRTYAR